MRVIDPLGLDWFYNDKNNEWEYIEDASFMINVNYDLESQITTTSIIQGEKEFLGFNGSALTWYEPRGLVRMWNARSGVLDNEDRTQPELQNESSRGPIPEGWYSIDPNTAHYYPYEIGKGKLWKINPDKGTLRDWGQGWTPLNPTRGNSTLKKKDLSEITFKDGIVIGFAQALALIPGSSRSGVTITAGLFRGLKRDVAARYSFLLSIPAIALSGLYEL